MRNIFFPHYLSGEPTYGQVWRHQCQHEAYRFSGYGLVGEAFVPVRAGSGGRRQGHTA